MDQNQVYNLPPVEQEPQPDENQRLENTQNLEMYDDSQNLSKYAIPQREGFTYGAAGIPKHQAEGLEMAMTQK